MSTEQEHPKKAFGWAARDSSGVFSPFKFSRRHEIVGVVTEVGSIVQKFNVGDKFAKAMGVKISVISTSPNKKDEAIEHLCADSFLVSRNEDQMQSHGELLMVGAAEKPLELPVYPFLVGRKIVAGSTTGGMKETQEMIDFAAKHNITAEIEVIPMDYVNIAVEHHLKADVRYRFVIDIGNTLKSTL
ncbi:hypothetical protein C1H46_004159 [Malus baccata]|uniref:Alcohol dehydrogenase-like C-terminal domain-containing protein n=1 Tax=Malus baccata TaxID=106549 RepID=A0A540NGM2_MALBA|nr:hypothetical protein C1H46_004159 [Malus baccata]